MNIKESRTRIRRNSLGVRKVPKGSYNINSSTRVCSACLRPLATIDRLGNPYVTVAHYRYKMSDWLHASICQDIRSCYRNTNKEDHHESRQTK